MDRRDVPATTDVAFIDLVKETWEPFQDNWLVATVSAAILSYVPFIIVGVPACIIAFVVAGALAMMKFDQGAVMLALFPLGIISALAFAALFNGLRAGWTRMLLDQAHGKPIKISDIKSGMPWFMDFFLALLIIGVGTTILSFCLIVPGIFFAIRTSLTPFLIVDRNMGCIEALKKSNEMVTGYSWQICGYYFIYFFANLVIGFIPILHIVVLPAAMGFFDMVLARIYLYRKDALAGHIDMG